MDDEKPKVLTWMERIELMKQSIVNYASEPAVKPPPPTEQPPLEEQVAVMSRHIISLEGRIMLLEGRVRKSEILNRQFD